MTQWADRWRHAADANPVARFLDILLRGIGQVMFQDNPLTGLIIAVALLVGAIQQHTGYVAAGAFLGVLVGTVTALLLRLDRDATRHGMFGFSPLLTGAAVPTLMTPSALMWVHIVIGAVLTVMATLAVTRLLDRWGIPASTAPFVLTAWLVVLAVHQYDRLGVTEPVASTPDPTGPIGAGDLLTGSLTGVSEVFLLGGWTTGAIVVAALAVNSRAAAGWALVGAFGSTAVALAVGVSGSAIAQGRYGFSAVLTAMALGCVYIEPSLRSARYALLGLVATLLLQTVLGPALAAVDIPAFTAPFISTLWIFLAVRRRVDLSSAAKDPAVRLAD